MLTLTIPDASTFTLFTSDGEIKIQVRKDPQSSKKYRVSIDAPRSVKILRENVLTKPENYANAAKP